MKNVNCLRCRFRREDNGNCTAVGGFCTAVAAAHCPLLRQYLDTELTPEEILPKDKADEIALKLMRLADLESICSYTRLRELAEADKDGRLVGLPCKVGDVVYGFHGEKTILPMVVKWIETYTNGWCIAVQYAQMAPRFYRFSDFGKTVFLTREEAEKALETKLDD